MSVNQGKKCIFRPIDKEEREIFHDVTKQLIGVGYDPLAVKLWPINGGDNSAMYIFLCATYLPPRTGKLEINLALVYISEMTLGKHEFKLERIERIFGEHEIAGVCEADDNSRMGDWVVKALVCEKGTLPENLATGFTEAFQGFVGPKFEVMVYCATQAVNGTNHMLICEGVCPHGEKLVAKIVLNESLADEGNILGHFSILSIEPIVISGGEGGWNVQPERWAGGSLPRPLAPGYEEAMRGFTGAKVEPLVFCGTQAVEGTNYMIICKSEPTALNAELHIDKLILNEEPGQAPGHFTVVSFERIV